ncbi:SMI1/KNR4 family protein [Oerskovia turbata]
MTTDLVDALSLAGTPALDAVASDVLAGHRFDGGGGFPPSYRRLVERAGFCRLFGLWLVHPPVRDGWADGWQGRAGRLTERFRAAFADGRDEGFDWMVEPDGDWGLPERLVVFAFSENGDALLWDTAARADDGELAVWCSPRLNGLLRLGSSLTAALPRLRSSSEPFAGRAPADVECLVPARLE